MSKTHIEECVKKDGKCIIYALSHPDKPDQLRYIGRTVQNLHKRLFGHINDAKPRNSKRKQWIMSIVDSGKRPRIWPIEVCDISKWEDRERYWIALFKPILLNVKPGGDHYQDQTGFKHSEETKRKYSESRKGRTPHINNRLKTIERNKLGLSTEIRAKISKTLTGRKLTKDANEKRQAHPNYQSVVEKFKQSNEARKKKVRCLELDREFESLKSASSFLGISEAGISRNAKSGRPIKGYTLSFI